MRTTDRFQSLDQVRAEKARLRVIRDGYREQMTGHWELMRDPEFRLGLARNAVSDLVGTWAPIRAFNGLFGADNGAAQGAGRSLKGQLITGLTSTILPILLKHFLTPERMERIKTGFMRSWERIMERFATEQDD